MQKCQYKGLCPKLSTNKSHCWVRGGLKWGIQFKLSANSVIEGTCTRRKDVEELSCGFEVYYKDSFNCDLNACKKFIKHIEYQGLFSMEYLRDKQGNDYFMEINLRNEGNGICVTEFVLLVQE